MQGFHCPNEFNGCVFLGPFRLYFEELLIFSSSMEGAVVATSEAKALMLSCDLSCSYLIHLSLFPEMMQMILKLQDFI